MTEANLKNRTFLRHINLCLNGLWESASKTGFGCLIILWMLTGGQINAQETPKNDGWSSIRTNTLSLRYGGKYSLDEYFSPLLYGGQQIGLKNEWQRSFAKVPKKEINNGETEWISVGDIGLTGAKVLQSQKRNYYYELGIQGGWGSVWQATTQWSGRTHKQAVKTCVGPFLQADLEVRQIGSNVNKPYSFDASIDAMLMAGVAYTIYKEQYRFCFDYQVKINVLGAEWLPQFGTSYYEVTEGQVGQNIAVGWWGNRQFVQQRLCLDIQLKRSTWRVGVEHEYMHYGSDHQQFKRQYIGVVIGTIFKYRIKGGAI